MVLFIDFIPILKKQILDNKPSKWICRIYIKEKVKYIVIPTGKEHIRYDFIEINDLYQFAEKLESRLMELI